MALFSQSLFFHLSFSSKKSLKKKNWSTIDKTTIFNPSIFWVNNTRSSNWISLFFSVTKWRNLCIHWTVSVLVVLLDAPHPQVTCLFLRNPNANREHPNFWGKGGIIIKLSNRDNSATKNFFRNPDKTGVKGGDMLMSYKSIFQDLRNAVDWVHMNVGVWK